MTPTPFEKWAQRATLILFVWTLVYLAGHVIVALVRGLI